MKETHLNIGKLLSANIIAQVIGIIIYPLLTRMYSPEDFGLLNLFLSIAGVLIILSTLEWYNAIVLPQYEKESCAVVHISFGALVALSVLIVLTIPFSVPIAKLFDTPELASYYWLLPIYVFLTGSWNILNYWYIRNKQYGRISGYQISQSFFSAGYKTGFAWLPFSGGLMYAAILSPLCAMLLSLKLAGKKILKPLMVVDKEECHRMAVKYINFPKFSTPRSLLNNIVGQLPVLVLTPLFGTRLVGFWGMALMLAFGPISTVSRALYQVFYQKTTESVNTHQPIGSFYRKFTLYTLCTIIPFFAVLGIFLPPITSWLLGEEWRVVGEYIRWMLPWLVLSLLSASTGYLTDIFFKQKAGLYFEILLAVSRVIGVGLGVIMNSFEIAIAGYAIGSAVVNAMQYVWYLSLVRRYDKTLQEAH